MIEKGGWQVVVEQTEKGAHRQVDALFFQHKSMRHSFVFTFLQALMDEATVLSVLTPSNSTDSEPSNMADDWRLLQVKRAQNWLCQSKFSSSAQLSPF